MPFWYRPFDSSCDYETQPTFFTRLNDSRYRWIYVIDLDREIFEVNNTVRFSLEMIPHFDWVSLFEENEDPAHEDGAKSRHATKLQTVPPGGIASFIQATKPGEAYESYFRL